MSIFKALKGYRHNYEFSKDIDVIMEFCKDMYKTALLTNIQKLIPYEFKIDL